MEKPKLKLFYSLDFNQTNTNVNRLVIDNYETSEKLDIIKRDPNRYEISRYIDQGYDQLELKDTKIISASRLNNATYLDLLYPDQKPIVLNKDSTCDYIIRESNCFYFITLVNTKLIKLSFDLDKILVYYEKSNTLYVYSTKDKDKINIYSKYDEKYIFRDSCIINEYIEDDKQRRKIINIDNKEEYLYSNYNKSVFFQKSNINIYYLDNYFLYMENNGFINELENINNLFVNDWIKLDYLLDDNYDRKFDNINFIPFYNPLFPDEIIKQYFKITRFEITSRNYKGLRIEKGSLALIIEVYDDKSTSN